MVLNIEPSGVIIHDINNVNTLYKTSFHQYILKYKMIHYGLKLPIKVTYHIHNIYIYVYYLLDRWQNHPLSWKGFITYFSYNQQLCT